MAKTYPICVYCELRDGDTDDHVVPKSLYPKPRPGNMVEVPACEPCNVGKSKDDDFLRDLMVMDWENETHPASQGDLKGKLIRAIGRNQSHLVREGRRARRLAPVYTPAGLLLGSAPSIPLEQARIERIFGRMVRGLYYKFTDGQRLPIDTTFESGKVHPMAKEATIKMFDRPDARHYQIGDTFECAYLIEKDKPTVTAWLLRFMNVFVVVYTNVKSPKPRTMTSFLGQS